MARINRGEILKKIVEELGLQPGAENAPRDVANTIVGTFDVMPEDTSRIARGAIRSTTGATTLLTTPTDRDFFMTGATLGMQSDATADNTFCVLTATPFDSNASSNILLLPKITLTAFSGATQTSFVPPLKLARGSVISMSHTFTVGASNISGTVTGYNKEILV